MQQRAKGVSQIVKFMLISERFQKLSFLLR